jgi:hypothetical protein
MAALFHFSFSALWPSEALMRTKVMLVGGLVLIAGACANKNSHAPPTFDKQLLVGKWKTVADALFVAGYEFAEDGGLKMSVKGMEKPIPGRYAWNGDRTLDLEYQLSDDAQKAYHAAVKAYKDDVEKNIESKKIPDKAGPGMLSAARDELPAKETLKASISEKPRLLILVDQTSGTVMTFERAE